MKAVKKTFQIKDKMAGFVFTVVGQSRTHFLAVDQFGACFPVNKTQAVRI